MNLLHKAAPFKNTIAYIAGGLTIIFLHLYASQQSFKINTAVLLQQLPYFMLMMVVLYFLLHLAIKPSKKAIEEYKYLFERNPSPMWIYDLETLAFLKVNKAAIEMYGYTEAEFLKMTIIDIRPSEDIERLFKEIKTSAVDNLKNIGEWRHITKDGTLKYVNVSSHFMQYKNRPSRLIITHDLTELVNARFAIKKINHELEQSLERYKSLFQSTNATLYEVDFATKHAIRGAGFYTSFGYEELESSLDWWFENIHPDDVKKIKSILEETFTNKKQVIEEKYRFKCADGNYKYVLDRAKIIYNEDGSVNSLIGIMQDIHLEYLQNEEIKKLSLVAEKTNNAVLILNSEGKITWVNNAFTKIYGYTLHEVKGKAPVEMLHGKHTQKTEINNIYVAIKERKSVTAELINYDKEGNAIWVSTNLSSVTDDTHNTYFVEVQTNIDDLKKHQTEIQSQNKILKEIASISSHKLRAPVANILALSQLLSKEEPYSDFNLKVMENVNTSAGQLDNIITEIVYKAARADVLKRTSN